MPSQDEAFAAIAAGQTGTLAGLLEADPGLIAARNEFGDSLLLAAIYAGRKEIFELLLDKGAAVDVFEATALGRDDLLRSRLDEEPARARAYSHDGWTPLHLAAFFGHSDEAATLLERGADVNARSRSNRFARENTPLHAAAANRQTEVARLLIERGADINAKDGHGFTPLGLAANSRNDILVIMLLERGAQVT